jgi:TctA family transporter
VVQRSPVGLVLIIIGVVLSVIGALVWLGALHWFGRLPGDIRVERPGFRFYAPIVSMLIVSLVLMALAALVRRFWP